MADVHGLAAFYALDALEAPERDTFEAHLPTCEQCRAELERLTAGVEKIAHSMMEPAPPSLKDAVMSAIDARDTASAAGPVKPIQQARRRRRLVVGVVAAAAAFVVGVVLTGVLNAPLEGVDAVIAADDARTLERADTPVGPIEIVWSNERGQGVFIGTNLPAVDAGETYALWVIDEAGPAPAGLFTPDADGHATVLIDGEVESGTTLGLTVEPAGGSPNPTGEILVAEPLA